jgi:uncharacterized protein YodC (DUF2158 family)
MASNFKAGDVVLLNSGGPKMTISWIENSEAWCVWFDANHAQQGAKFPLTALKPASV